MVGNFVVGSKKKFRVVYQKDYCLGREWIIFEKQVFIICNKE